MPPQPSPKTLFHLVPESPEAKNALQHPDNKRFISSSDQGAGLEIGFHVPSLPNGRTIARLGRDADLVLGGETLSRVHVAFELHPETLVILLAIRSSLLHPRVAVIHEGCEDEDENADAAPDRAVEGDCVIQYGESYTISIGTNIFQLRWHLTNGLHGRVAAAVLRERAVQDYQDSQKQAEALISRLQPTQIDPSEFRSWYSTRLHTTRSFSIREVPAARVSIGHGAFGEVFKGVDSVSGGFFAVKQIKLSKTGDLERARSTLHREIKTLELLSHENIIKLLATKGWGTDIVEIFMPLCDGTLADLAEKRIMPDDDLCMQVLQQVLQALDFLAFRNLCHRDIKPQNILYSGQGQATYRFQVADFGLANHAHFATTFCGTALYIAPEFFAELGSFQQSPKVDVWSLFATLLFIHSGTAFPPPRCRGYGDVLRAVREIRKDSVLEPMARENPHHRASAAQMLVALFDGKGLTTPRSQVLKIEPDDAADGVVREPTAQQAPGREVAAVEGRQRLEQQPRPAKPPLVVYPPPPHRRRAQGGGLPQAAAAPQRVTGPRRGGVAKPQGRPTGRRLQVPLGRELDRVLGGEPSKGLGKAPDKSPDKVPPQKEKLPATRE